MYTVSELFEGDYDLVDGKFQFGDLAHAKKRAIDIGGRPLTWNKSKNNNVWHGYTSDPGSHAVFIIKRVANNPMKKSRKKNPISNDLKKFNRVLREFDRMSKSALMQFWSAHQRGRGGAGLGIRSRNLVNDLANIAANLATAKGTKGDTKKMYEQIAHDIVLDAKRTARKKNPEHEIRELILFSENSPSLHNQYVSIMKNLSRKKKRGIYDPALAAKLWKYWIDEGVKQYNLEILGGGRSLKQNVFTVADRKQAAIEMEDQEQEGVFSLEYLELKNPKRRANPITRGQLENFVYEMDGSGREELRAALKVAVDAQNDFRISAAKRLIYKDLAKMIRKEIKKYDPSRGDYPSRNPRKKNRATKRKNYFAFLCWPKASGYGKVTYAYISDTRKARVGITEKKYDAAIFQTKARASAVAQLLADEWPGAQAGIAPETSTAAQIRASCEKLKGARRRNPVGPTQREIDQAGELFKDFTGNAPDKLQKVRIRNPKTGLVIGELDGVLYTTVRDGKTEKYKHDFKKGNRPHLVASHDGQSLHILGGDYEFTERGIEG